MPQQGASRSGFSRFSGGRDLSDRIRRSPSRLDFWSHRFQIQRGTAIVFDEAVAGVSSSSFALVEQEIGADVRSGSSSSSGSIAETRIATDARTGVSSSQGARAEAWSEARVRSGVGSSSYSIAEGRLAADSRFASSSSTFSTVASKIGSDAVSAVSSSTATIGEIYVPPAGTPDFVPRGLMAFLYPPSSTPTIYRDFPRGVQHNEHRLEESWSRPPIQPRPRRRAVSEPDSSAPDLDELLVLGLV